MATNYTDTSVNELIISKISQEQYLELSSQGMLNENELYLIENEILDAMGHAVMNVADPTELSDATNKHYVDLVSSFLSGQVSGISSSLSDYVPLSGNSFIQNNLSVGSNLYVSGSSLCSIIDNEISSQTSSQFEGLSNAVSTLGGSLSNYVPLSGNTLVSNILSIETDLYVRDTSISDLISGGSSRVILREWF